MVWVVQHVWCIAGTEVGEELHYFGQGHQLKISKVADSLYSSLKDVLGYVMIETAKRSEFDCKFQMPKHTSYIGTIVKVNEYWTFPHSIEYCNWRDCS